MNAKVVRILNLRGDGRHRADPLEATPLPDPAVVAETRADSTPTVVIPVADAQPEVEPETPAPVPIAADYRDLRVFPAVVRGACRVGLTGLGTRGARPVPFTPDYGLERFTADAPDDDFGPEFDRIEARTEAGFYQASRVFHSADTAGFPAVQA